MHAAWDRNQFLTKQWERKKEKKKAAPALPGSLLMWERWEEKAGWVEGLGVELWWVRTGLELQAVWLMMDGQSNVCGGGTSTISLFLSTHIHTQTSQIHNILFFQHQTFFFLHLSCKDA